MKNISDKSVLTFALMCGISGVLVTGCGPNAETVEEYRMNSQSNSKKNLTSYVRKQDNVVEFDIMSDSTISKSCPGGDGWATGTMVMADKSEQKVKCQTNGSSKGTAGCMALADFNTRYADQEGVCDESIKKIALFK